MSQTIEEKNKALVLEAFDTLFNRRDYAAAEKYWSPDYIQHSAHIEPGRDGLFNLIRSAPDTLLTNTSSLSPRATMSLSTDVFQDMARRLPGSPRTLSGSRTAVLPEHWDVLQDEATKAQSKSGLPMFGEEFSTEKAGFRKDSVWKSEPLEQEISHKRSQSGH